MWPFSSGKGKDTAELEQEIPGQLQEFFKSENPEKKYEAHLELSNENALVQKTVEKHKNDPYSYEFERYKLEEDTKKVAFVNCAELQAAVIKCLNDWNGTDLSFCEKQIQRNSSCIELQTKALKRLHYESCVSKKQCQQIRYLVDEAFVRNFGQFGQHINDKTREQFVGDVDKSFGEVWN